MARARGNDAGLAALLEDAMLGERASVPKARAVGKWGVERVVVKSRGCPAE